MVQIGRYLSLSIFATRAGRPGARDRCARACGLPHSELCRHPGSFRSMAGLYTPLPTLRRRPSDVCARLGASVVRYSFTVRDLHPLLLAGLPVHAANLQRPEGSRRCRRGD